MTMQISYWHSYFCSQWNLSCVNEVCMGSGCVSHCALLKNYGCL